MVTFMKQSLIGAAVLAAGIVPGLAADPYEPQVYTPEPVYQQEEPELDYGGWYIRGDVDYHGRQLGHEKRTGSPHGPAARYMPTRTPRTTTCPQGGSSCRSR